MPKRFFSRIFIACGILLLAATGCSGVADQRAIPAASDKKDSDEIGSSATTERAGDPESSADRSTGDSGTEKSTATDPCSPERLNAGSPEELQRAQAECNKQEQAEALERGFPYQGTDWEAGLGWWPYRPVYRFGPDTSAPGTEVVFRTSDKDGKAPDPVSQNTAFGVVYDRLSPPGTKSVAAILDEGGFFSKTSYHPPGSSIGIGPVAKKKTVIVRGRVAYVFEMYRNPKDGQARGNYDRRTIFWESTSPNGGLLLQEFLVSPVVFTEQQTVDLINALEEVR